MADDARYALVVDDEALIRMEAAAILKDAGFNCYEAENGDKAIELLQTCGENVVLLFSDVDMPGSADGFVLARYAAEHWPEIRIVIASGRHNPSPEDLPEGATFIGKPFDEKIVTQHLARHLPDEKKPELLKRALTA